MRTLLSYFGNQRMSLMSIGIFVFLIVICAGGNSERIGIGFVSFSALSSIVIIISGFKFKKLDSSVPSILLYLILGFTFISYFIYTESLVALYSVSGNILLSFAIAHSFNKYTSKAIIDFAAITFSFIFISYYIEGFWGQWGGEEDGSGVDLSRQTYLQMNPNVVSEYISIGVISLLYIFFLFESRRYKWLKYFLVFVCFLAFLPLLQAASRKGIALFVFSVLIFLFLKYKWYQGGKQIIIGSYIILFGAVAIMFAPSIKFDAASVILGRFSGDVFETESNLRLDLVRKGVEKGMESPIYGHGMEASRDEKFLRSAGLWNDFADSPLNTHNGLVNIFMKGGILFLILFITLFVVVIKKLYILSKKENVPELFRMQCILALIYTVIFLTHIVSSGNGELLKLGWFLFGFGLGAIKNANNQILIYSNSTLNK